MTPTAKVVSLLTNNLSVLPGLEEEHIHAFVINKDEVNNKECMVVVSEIPAGSHDFGNNSVIGTYKRIQIDFYYPKDYVGDMDLIEKSVKSFLRTHSIRCYSDAGHVMTPDTENIINTLKFNYLEMED
ncbi:DUF806 family protein [Lactobacillaceae bacterium 24-114]